MAVGQPGIGQPGQQAELEQTRIDPVAQQQQDEELHQAVVALNDRADLVAYLKKISPP